MGRIRLQLHLDRAEEDPLPPWPGDEFVFDLELTLWPCLPPGPRGYASAGEPPEEGGWELRQAECRSVADAEGASVCRDWLWSKWDTPEVRERIEAALEAASCR